MKCNILFNTYSELEFDSENICINCKLKSNKLMKLNKIYKTYLIITSFISGLLAIFLLLNGNLILAVCMLFFTLVISVYSENKIK